MGNLVTLSGVVARNKHHCNTSFMKFYHLKFFFSSLFPFTTSSKLIKIKSCYFSFILFSSRFKMPVVIFMWSKKHNHTAGVLLQRKLFLSEANNRETIAAIEANNDTQKPIEKFPLLSFLP